MRRLLLFAYNYPPQLAGVRRTVKFIRYLCEFGWQCSIITVKPVRGSGWDDAPLREIAPARPEVRPTPSLDPYRLSMALREWRWPLMRRVYQGPARSDSLTGVSTSGGFSRTIMEFLRRGVFLPDDRVGWLPFAVAAGLAHARRWKPHALYSTSYPHTAHLAAALVRQITGIPWLADFRDGWTQNPAFFRPLTPLHAWVQRRLERCVARRADALVTVSPPITRHLQQLRGNHPIPAVTIYNGFDDSDFPLNASGDDEPVIPATPRGDTTVAGLKPFSLLYTGTFFGTRTPETFLEAVARLRRRRKDFASRARILLHTALEEQWIARISTLGLGENVELQPFLPHREALRRQRQADALLLVTDTGPGSEIIVTQKVFEYLASGRPIWALCGEAGACRELLERTGGAYPAPPENPDAAADALEALFDSWLAGQAKGAPAEYLAPFHRREQTRRLAELLDQITHHGDSGA
jgi:glycosyltransferase involved in cell wall biosynthesis